MRRRSVSFIALFVLGFFTIQLIVFLLIHQEYTNFLESSENSEPNVVEASSPVTTSPIKTKPIPLPSKNPLSQIINYKSSNHHFETVIPSNSVSKFYTPPFFIHENSSTILLSLFDSLFDEKQSYLLEPPCLLADMTLYLGSVSVSITRQRVHFPIISNFASREYKGTYEEILQYDYHNGSTYFQNHPFFERNQKSQLYQMDTSKTSQYKCVFKIDNEIIVKPITTYTNHQGGSLVCELNSAMVSLLEQHKTIQGLLVASQNDNVFDQLLAKFTLQHSFEMNANMDTSTQLLQNQKKKPFRVILSCAPLLWEQIQQGVIIEWIEYHRIVGVEHFFIYLREDSEANMLQIINYLKPYLESHLVTLIQWRFGPLHELYNAFQLPQSIDTSARATDLSDWFIISDTDEFFYPVQKDTIYEVMEQESNKPYDHFSVINWFFQGKNRPTETDPLPQAKYILQRHISKCSRPNPHGSRTKTIGRSGKDIFFTAEDAHYFHLSHTKPLETKELYMRHYYSSYGFRYCPFMGQGDEGANHSLDPSLWDRFGDKLSKAIDQFYKLKG